LSPSSVLHFLDVLLARIQETHYLKLITSISFQVLGQTSRHLLQYFVSDGLSPTTDRAVETQKWRKSRFRHR